MDISAEAVQLIVNFLVAVCAGFALGSVWKWFQFFRG